MRKLRRTLRKTAWAVYILAFALMRPSHVLGTTLSEGTLTITNASQISGVLTINSGTLQAGQSRIASHLTVALPWAARTTWR